MNKIPNSSHMIGEFFREGKSLSPQARYSLSHGIIKSFYIVCLTSILSYSSVSFFRKNYSVRKDKSLYNLQHIDDKLRGENPTIPSRQLHLFYQYILLQSMRVNTSMANQIHCLLSLSPTNDHISSH